jgi:hypothetical protein
MKDEHENLVFRLRHAELLRNSLLSSDEKKSAVDNDSSLEMSPFTARPASDRCFTGIQTPKDCAILSTKN